MEICITNYKNVESNLFSLFHAVFIHKRRCSRLKSNLTWTHLHYTTPRFFLFIFPLDLTKLCMCQFFLKWKEGQKLRSTFVDNSPRWLRSIFSPSGWWAFMALFVFVFVIWVNLAYAFFADILWHYFSPRRRRTKRSYDNIKHSDAAHFFRFERTFNKRILLTLAVHIKFGSSISVALHLSQSLFVNPHESFHSVSLSFYVPSSRRHHFSRFRRHPWSFLQIKYIIQFFKFTFLYFWQGSNVFVGRLQHLSRIVQYCYTQIVRLCLCVNLHSKSFKSSYHQILFVISYLLFAAANVWFSRPVFIVMVCQMAANTNDSKDEIWNESKWEESEQR